ncbi:hypothetical protein ENBRE01_1859 [Enteropsectra breve]|nr:hypothetical protein ENBRE01_1859 [Enteropsectra breve]
MIRRIASIMLTLTCIQASSLGRIFGMFYKQDEQHSSVGTMHNQYTAVVKLITAPVQFQKELISSSFNEMEKPFHYHLKSIITDSAWKKNRNSAELSEKLLKLSSLLGINLNTDSSSIHNIIDTLAEKIDAERTEENHVFKCTFVTELVIKGSCKVDMSETDKLSTVEGMLDDRGVIFPYGSLQNVFLKVPRLKSVEDKLNSGQNSAKYRFYKNSYTKMAVIFSINNDERSKFKGLITHYDKISRENKHQKYCIRAFLYLDKTCSQEGVYKTVTFADTNDFIENGPKIIKDKNNQLLHVIYTIGQ